ncbi:MAG: DUF488 domain-containing protein [Dehalococcoidia bacterium]|nr:DUF488 domain-containing protein [Dehalococcoidia bacterium]
MLTIHTIGHSNHEFDYFLRLLQLVKIEVLVDIRSNPNSGWVSFAEKNALEKLMTIAGIKYLYMGDVLGGQPADPTYLNPVTGRADYQLIRRSESFQQGIARLVHGCDRYKICLMCAEENPAHCHRSLLVGEALSHIGVRLFHIRGDERIQTDEELSKERAGVSLSQQMLPM